MPRITVVLLHPGFRDFSLPTAPDLPFLLRRQAMEKQFKNLIGKEMPLRKESRTHQMAASHLLTRAGILVDIAGNGQETPTSLQSRIYDAIPLDVIMPETDGLAATRNIRRPPRLDLPIIALRQHQQSRSG
jgi:CheY-like chemotaxis protein